MLSEWIVSDQEGHDTSYDDDDEKNLKHTGTAAARICAASRSRLPLRRGDSGSSSVGCAGWTSVTGL